MGETKPLKLSTMLSIVYSDFRPDFREVRTSEGFLYIADLGRRAREVGTWLARGGRATNEAKKLFKMSIYRDIHTIRKLRSGNQATNRGLEAEGPYGG